MTASERWRFGVVLVLVWGGVVYAVFAADGFRRIDADEIAPVLFAGLFLAGAVMALPWAGVIAPFAWVRERLPDEYMSMAKLAVVGSLLLVASRFLFDLSLATYGFALVTLWAALLGMPWIVAPPKITPRAWPLWARVVVFTVLFAFLVGFIRAMKYL